MVNDGPGGRWAACVPGIRAWPASCAIADGDRGDTLGMQSATAGELSVPDLPTTVLTMDLESRPTSGRTATSPDACHPGHVRWGDRGRAAALHVGLARARSVAALILRRSPSWPRREQSADSPGTARLTVDPRVFETARRVPDVSVRRDGAGSPQEREGCAESRAAVWRASRRRRNPRTPSRRGGYRPQAARGETCSCPIQRSISTLAFGTVSADRDKR